MLEAPNEDLVIVFDWINPFATTAKSTSSSILATDDNRDMFDECAVSETGKYWSEGE